MSDIAITFSVLGGAIVLFVWNRFPVEIVALLVALSLYFTQALTSEQALAGFSDPTVILIAGLFVVSMGLESSGITTWIGQQLIAYAGTSRTRLMVIMASIVALLTALISVNGAVAALMPMVVIVAVRLGRPPSQLLMPLAFAAHAGSQLTLTGSPVNVLISEALANTAGGRAIGFFEFSLVGLPLLIGTIGIVVLFGEKLLPYTEPQYLPKDLGQVPAQFKDRYFGGGDLWYVTVTDTSSLVGYTLTEARDEAHNNLVRIIMVQNASTPHTPGQVIEAQGTLVLRGETSALEKFCLAGHLERNTHSTSMVTPTTGVAEVMVAPGSGLAGEKVFPGMITESGQLVVAAVQRAGQDLNENERAQPHITLREGDVLLLKGTWSALSKYTVDDSVLVVDEPDQIRQQAAPLGKSAWSALTITGAMILFLTLGIYPAAVVTTIAAMAMIVTSTVSLTKAHRSISWTTIILVAAMIPMSTAISQSGAADLIARAIATAVAGQAPQIVLLGLFLVTVVLGQLISNTATALVLIPVAIAVAADLNLSPIPLLMTICISAAASFLTPVATPANTMIMGPAGYKFGDYWKLGLPLVGWYGIIAVGLVPVIWSF